MDGGGVGGGRKICAQHYDPSVELFIYDASLILYT